MRARAVIVAEARGLTRLRGEVPLALRATPGGVHLVATVGGPLGGDDVELDVTVGPGAVLRVSSAAASVAQPSRHGDASRFAVVARVAPGAGLDWSPSPTVLAAGCHHDQDVVVELGAGAWVRWRDELVLGRWGEPGGRGRSRVRVTGPDGVLVHHELDVGRSGAHGPAALGGSRAVVTVVHAGPGPDRPPATVARAGRWAARLPAHADAVVVLAGGDSLDRAREAAAGLELSGP